MKNNTYNPAHISFIKKINRILFLIISIVCAVCYSSFATHLMGGDLTYKYVGASGSNYNYEVTLKLYRYCSAGSSQLPNNMGLGVYEQDTANPNADKNLVNIYTLPLISQRFIMPPASDTSCHFITVVCMEEGTYITTISVPASAGGYHLISDRCCRNNNIANLSPPNVGEAYYAFIPPTSIVNNSPVFAAPPLPYFCQSDSINVLYTAYDSDRDSFAYSFVVPYQGISDGSNPNPNPPALYPWPIPSVIYDTAYSVAQPFGTGSYASVDSSTGISTYYAPLQGYYVVALEVREYRNGQLIGIIRRDLQTIVIVCPNNPAPIWSPSGTGLIAFTLLEGQTLCFNPTFYDLNGDSLFLNKAGNLFNSLLTNPVATLPDASGDSIVTSPFCWTTHVGQASTLPYFFSIIVNDNGCPTKSFNVTYSVTVSDSASALPRFIVDDSTICAGSTVTFTDISLLQPTSRQWYFPGATPDTSTQQNPSVIYDTPGNYDVTLIAVNSNGVDTVTIQNYISVNTPLNNGAISINNNTLLSPYSQPNYWYSTININPIDSGLYHLCTDTTKYFAIGLDANGCRANSDTINCITTGIIKIINAPNEVRIFPNPNDGTFVLEFNSLKNELADLSIIDVMGQKIYSDKWSCLNGINKKQIEIKKLASGIYLLSLKTKDFIYKDRVILQK